MGADLHCRPPSRGDLLDAAFRTAVDYVDHRKYDTEAGALKSLRRRCRGFTARQYEGALRRAVRLLDSVEEVIAPFDPPYDGYQAIEHGWPAGEEAARALHQRFHGFRLDTCRSAIGWVLFWRHWK